MTDRLSSPTLRLLQATACVIIIMWGIRAASQLLVPILMGLLLAYSFLPLPNWLKKRFNLGKNAAIALAVAMMGTLILGLVLMLYWRVMFMRAKLPIYQSAFESLYENVMGFMQAHGIVIAGLEAGKSTSDRALEFILKILPEAGNFLGDGLLIAILALVFLSTMAEQAGDKRGPFAEILAYYGGDVQRYVATAAKSNGIAALANLVLMVALGVDFSILWCVLYFFLAFIPTVGFIISLVPQLSWHS